MSMRLKGFSVACVAKFSFNMDEIFYAVKSFNILVSEISVKLVSEISVRFWFTCLQTMIEKYFAIIHNNIRHPKIGRIVLPSCCSFFFWRGKGGGGGVKHRGRRWCTVYVFKFYRLENVILLSFIAIAKRQDSEGHLLQSLNTECTDVSICFSMMWICDHLL